MIENEIIVTTQYGKMPTFAVCGAKARARSTAPASPSGRFTTR
jgi:hypothetical protein